ncbi:hypothetical protein PHET_03610 [Paragonimus heterotremus]|uniref:Uncharacterized protein n=1 Tax=Paragonimus heterotremus TaxID=100268 RepID=A0A8J4SQQ5_9TREM|nr:hypothetical protein PHET_03610 [Paragonimus heterotremus]
MPRENYLLLSMCVDLLPMLCITLAQTLVALVDCIPVNNTGFSSKPQSASSRTTTPFSSTNYTIAYTDTSAWNDTTRNEEDSFVEDSAGVWVISIISGTCIFTIAFIVRALFSRAEAFRDPQENMFNPDINDDQMGMTFGINTGLPGSDFSHL